MKKSSDTKELIIETAQRMFREKGYSSVTLNAICQEAKITKTTFYYYFHSKEDLIQMNLYRPRPVTSELLQKVFAASSYWMQLWLLTENDLENTILAGRDNFRQIIKMSLEKNRGLFALPDSDLIELSVPLIEKAQTAGEIRNHSDARALLEQCWKLRIGCITCWCFQNDEYDLRRELFDALEVAYDVSPESRFPLE